MTGLRVIQTVASIAENSGGPARTIRSLSEAMARAGASVELLAGHNPARDDALLRPAPALVTTRLIERRRRFDLPPYDFMAALAPEASPRTILHDNGIWHPANICATSSAWRLGIPMVISPHGMLEPWALTWHPWRKRLVWAAYQRWAIGAVRGLLATSEQELAGIRRKVPRKPVAVIPNGVACPAQVPDRRHRDAPQPRTLLFMSRLHPKKNLPVLIDAWAVLAADTAFDDWTLWIAGPDELGHSVDLAQRIERLNLGARIRLDGPVPEAGKATAFATADLFVLPSLSENFGVVVAEALAHGVPVIATTGTPWSSLIDEDCGWWVKADRSNLVSALAAAMALPPQARLEMGERGHAFVRRSLSWDRIAPQTLAYYEWLLSGGSKPDFVDS